MSEKLCMNHTDRKAVSKCISCFKPICEECIIRYKGDDYCSNACAEGSEETGQRIAEIAEGQSRVRRKRLIRKIFFFITLCIMAYLIYKYVIQDKKMMDKIQGHVEEAKGKVLPPDDFYHAKEGVWKMETTVHLLKSRKFVSSDTELKEYLVYTAKPGETVRMTEAMGRWKKLDLIEKGKVKATGWADAEDGRAEWISDILVEE